MPDITISPDTIKEVQRLMEQLNARFTPPEFIPGCEVKDVTDKDLYATDNGWIEAVVGHHNQQRCRWRGQYSGVGTADYVDVLYFPDRKLFEVYGQGGTASPATGGWPYTVLNANTGLKYTSLPTAESEASNNDLLLLGPGTHDLGASTLSITKDLRIAGPGWDVCKITSSDNPTINVNGPTVYIEDVEIESTSTDATVSAFEATSEVHLDRVAARTTGGTVENRGFWLNVSLGDTMYLHDCLSFTNDDVDVLNSGNTLYISGFRSRLRGITAGGGNTFLVWPLIRNAGTGLSGTSINGWFVDSSSSDDAYQVVAGTVFGPLGIGGFPADDIVMIDTVPYSTITAAIAAASSGDAIKAGFGAFNENLTFDFSGRLVGLGPERCRIYSSAADDVLEVTANNGSFEGLDFLQSTTTDAKACIYINAVDNAMLRDCILLHNGAATNAYGVRVTGDGNEFQRCEITASGGTNNWAIYSDADSSEITLRECILTGDVEVTGSATTLDVFGGYIDGDIVITTGNPTITLRGLPTITGAVPSVATGFYQDSNRQMRSVGDVDGITNLLTSDNDIYRTDNVSVSDFVATIATLPGGADLTYNAPSSGDEANLVPKATSQLGKLVLHNTTRGDDALISDCNTGTNTITLTDTVPGAWANGDTITIRSQTNTDVTSSGYFVDIEITSEIDTLRRGIEIFGFARDSGSAGIQVQIHPYESHSNSKQFSIITQAANELSTETIPVKIASDRFCLRWFASGSNTMDLFLRVVKQYL